MANVHSSVALSETPAAARRWGGLALVALALVLAMSALLATLLVDGREGARERRSAVPPPDTNAIAQRVSATPAEPAANDASSAANAASPRPRAYSTVDTRTLAEALAGTGAVLGAAASEVDANSGSEAPPDESRRPVPEAAAATDAAPVLQRARSGPVLADAPRERAAGTGDRPKATQTPPRPTSRASESAAERLASSGTPTASRGPAVASPPGPSRATAVAPSPPVIAAAEPAPASAAPVGTANRGSDVRPRVQAPRTDPDAETLDDRWERREQWLAERLRRQR